LHVVGFFLILKKPGGRNAILPEIFTYWLTVFVRIST